ncbi:hypothetical protein GCM10011492_31770 [Flexivirga endophytica]|uniref:Uncharacterized protein n=1 Tax=Flexivirga endophytica TaxID=1849103 RepID=A0A916WY29_9MICO|nr:hypothetical protein [Flexivirga endophytica]GGB38642.1 hypothetical protein GCM10011492_31770 [Flexivirga endophytica]GHB46662.1 hypothetical protein GCM10008112_14160 [Flexivirga endophytica]
MTLLGNAVLAVVTLVIVGAPVVAPVIQRWSQLSKGGDGGRSQQLADRQPPKPKPQQPQQFPQRP